MKRLKFLLIITLFCFSFVTTAPVFAHPGRTDKYGCHKCYTNCKKWGLKYNQYHCHRAK